MYPTIENNNCKNVFDFDIAVPKKKEIFKGDF